MDPVTIRGALAALEPELERARGARKQIECKHTGTLVEGGSYDEPEAALASILTQIHDVLVVLLEAAGLPDTRSRLLQQWEYFGREGGIDKATYLAEYDYLESKPFEYLETLIHSLGIIAGEGLPPVESYELAKLETILRKTPVLLHKRGINPNNERDVQQVMHDYLEAFFTEYKRVVRVSGVIKDFEPDGGIRNLKTAIEFKYAATKAEVSKALSGIFEDHSGYSGSLDWVRFYSVIYQTQPFESEDRMRSELTRAGMITWKVLLLTGAGSRGGHGRTRTARIP